MSEEVRNKSKLESCGLDLRKNGWEKTEYLPKRCKVERRRIRRRTFEHVPIIQTYRISDYMRHSCFVLRDLIHQCHREMITAKIQESFLIESQPVVDQKT